MSEVVETRESKNPVIVPEVVCSNLRHFMDNYHLNAAKLQDIAGKESVQAVYKWIRGEGIPSIDALYAICCAFSREGIHIEDFLKEDGIPLKEDANVKWTKYGDGVEKQGKITAIREYKEA